MLGPLAIGERMDELVSDADLCRKRGWPPGTRLIGDEGRGPSIIEITAVGERAILAKLISHNGTPQTQYETTWTLRYRDWKEDTA